ASRRLSSRSLGAAARGSRRRGRGRAAPGSDRQVPGRAGRQRARAGDERQRSSVAPRAARGVGRLPEHLPGGAARRGSHAGGEPRRIQAADGREDHWQGALMAPRHLFTSESVTEGHPDKIADQISDSVLDALIAQDKQSRVACEVLVTTGLAVVAGEITSHGYVEIPALVRQVIGEIGYDSAEYGFDSHTCAVVTTIDDQSPDIARGLNTGGPGDQGLMSGFACRETRQLMPLPIMLAHGLTKRLAWVRRKGVVPYLRPDGKSQVTVEYDGDRPMRVVTVVVSSQ